MTADDAQATTSAPQHRPRWRRPKWIAASVALVVVVAVSAATAVFQYGLPHWMGDGDINGTYRGEAGSQRYQVHLPPQHDGSTPLPLVMAIHGCGMTGYGRNSMKGTTQLNELADREGFIVVYPTQRVFRDALNCWNSADPREQHRYTGEPALLAGVVQQVMDEYSVDPDQVHVAGASSGAGTAVILGVTYPDVFATVTSVAGGEYGLNQVDPDAPGETPPEYTARQAWAQMGDRHRLVPLLIIQGEEDEVVPPLVAERLAQQWTAVGDLSDDGLLNGSLDLTETTTSVPPASGRHGYEHKVLSTTAQTSLVESYLVHDMGHVWSGPAGVGLFTDHAGPDASAIMWDFASRHPMGDDS